MFRLFYIAFLIPLIFSCGKKSDSLPPDPPPVIVMPDTLSAGWNKVSTGATKTFTDIFFSDNSTGYACGQGGIYKSTNGGISWAILNSTATPTNIGVANANKACFIDETEKIFLTTDGTNIQQAAATQLNPQPAFKDVFFSSNNVCYLSSVQYVWKSVNGGSSFDTLYNFKNSISDGNFLYFVNDLTGWINRRGNVYKTTDGGVNWTLQLSGTQRSGGMKFINANTGFVAVDNSVYKTTDGGITFQNIKSFASNTYLDLDFVSATTGYVSAANHIYKTTDGGATWTQIVAVGDPQTILEIHFTDANHGWACGTNGLLLRFN
jgi:photosystem II stability/assembly factor-like uncharacterized protein